MDQCKKSNSPHFKIKTFSRLGGDLIFHFFPNSNDFDFDDIWVRLVKYDFGTFLARVIGFATI